MLFPPVPAYILCGGRSSRFGSDKGRADQGGRPQIIALGDALRAAGHEQVYYVADRAERYRDLGIDCLVDSQADSGPLAGWSRAIQHCAAELARQPTDKSVNSVGSVHSVESVNAGQSGEPQLLRDGWLLLVSCDQTHWSARWLDELRQATAGGILAAAFFDADWQPLPALVHVALRGEVDARLQAGDLSLKHLLGDLQRRGACAQVVTAAPPSGWSFNTPDEWERVRQR